MLPSVCCVTAEIFTEKLAPGAQRTEPPCVTVTLFVLVILTDKVVALDTFGGPAACIIVSVLFNPPAKVVLP
jgi:hypothetical protein